MTGFALLDVAIGVIFTLLTFSLVASALQEALASILNWRGRILRRGIFRLLQSGADTAEGTKLVSAVTLSRENVKKAEGALDLLMDPAIRPLYGPKSLFARLWDSISPDRKAVEKAVGDAERAVETKVNEVMRNLGRMPSNIPKGTFAQALFNQLRLKFNKAKQEIAKEKAREALQDGFSDGRAPEDVALHRVAADIDDDLSGADVDAALRAGRELTQGFADEADAALKKVADAAAALPVDAAVKEKLLRALREVSIKEAVQERLDKLETLGGEARAALEVRIQRADEAITAALNEAAEWFDTSMDRVTGWYVRRIKYFLFLIGFVLAMGLNFNLIGYSGQLINNESLRDQIVARATLAVEQGAVGELKVAKPNKLRDTAVILDTGGSGGDPNGAPNGRVEESEILTGLDRISPAIRAELELPDPLPAAETDSDNQQGETEPTPPALPDVDAEVLKNAANVLTAALLPPGDFDLDGDGIITEEEANTAVDTTLQGIEEALRLSADTVQSELGGDTVQMGWTCTDGDTEFGFWGCLSSAQNWSATAVLSWFLIGFGCTLGGQFWFDLLQGLLKVRTSAQGVKTDVRKLFGGGQAPAPAGSAAAGS